MTRQGKPCGRTPRLLPRGDYCAGSMRDREVQKRRRRLLRCRHVAPLTAYAAKLRRRRLGEVPEFDPLDGGVEAQVLFLFEKPGPKTAVNGGGSGFISRNNDDPTANATFDFMQKARIPRTKSVLWNVIPWWNGDIAINRRELQQGVRCVRELIGKLPRLRAIVLVGRKAAKAKPYLRATGVTLFTSAHPSPRVRWRWRRQWEAIPFEWAKVRKCID